THLAALSKHARQTDQRLGYDGVPGPEYLSSYPERPVEERPGARIILARRLERRHVGEAERHERMGRSERVRPDANRAIPEALGLSRCAHASGDVGQIDQRR